MSEREVTGVILSATLQWLNVVNVYGLSVQQKVDRLLTDEAFSFLGLVQPFLQIPSLFCREAVEVE